MELGVRFELTWAKPAAYKTAPINRYGNPACSYADFHTQVVTTQPVIRTTPLPLGYYSTVDTVLCNGTPTGIRTPDTKIRNLVLYPTEL